MSTKDKFEDGGKGTSRRNILQAAGWAVGACGALPIASAWGQQVGGEGPIVWLGMNQEELDAAYDQSAYASNREQIVEQEMLSKNQQANGQQYVLQETLCQDSSRKCAARA